ncbi:MAG: DUF4132 domain-containing protein [Clostridia bacterium]|nr:DUF4132 domain-containing protein [Clostridia bacterium]
MNGLLSDMMDASRMLKYRYPNASPQALAFAQAVEERRKKVSTERMLFFTARYSESKDYESLTVALKAGRKPSEFFQKEMKWMFGPCISERHREAFLWAADHCLDRPYTMGWFRRPLRSPSYQSYDAMLCMIARQFYVRAVVDADVCDVLSGNLPADALAYVRECQHGYCAEIIAYELNRGNERLKKLLAAALNGDESAPKVSREMFHGILLSQDEELQEHLGRLLLAARLQEGLRQSICECADEGTLPGFLRILRVIAENDLLRYSSVKRAVGVWTGLLAEDAADLERVSKKTLSLLLNGLENPESRETMLQSEDSMEIHMGLWSEAVADMPGAVQRAVRLVQCGSRHQALVCGFFGRALQNSFTSHLLAKEALEKWPEDQEILAVYLPGFLSNVTRKPFIDANLQGRERSLSPHFADAAEARRFYDILKTQYTALKGKEKTFSPCVFPWWGAALRKSDLASMLCELAVMTGEPDLMDDALTVLPQVESHFRNGMLENLLTPLKRPAQRTALLEALADKSPDTRKKAFDIADKASPADLDFSVIENHLRLKAADARVNCEKLLMRQEDERLLNTVRRLLSDPQEQKRAAAYDLALLIAGDEARKRLKPACAELLQNREPDDTRGKILWNSAVQALAPEEKPQFSPDALFSEADVFEPDLSFFDTDETYQDAFMKLFPDSQISKSKTGIGDRLKGLLAGKQNCPSRVQARADFQDLDALIEAHKEDPLGEDPFRIEKDQLLGYGHLRAFWFYQVFPGAAVWEEWYASLGSPERLARVILLLYAESSPDSDLMDRLFGEGFSKPENPRYREQMNMICAYLFERHADSESFFSAAMRAARWVIREVPEGRFAVKTGMKTSWCVTYRQQLGWLLSFLIDAPDAAWARCFHVRTALMRRFEREYLPLVRVQEQNRPPWYPSWRNDNLISYAVVQPYRYGRREGRIEPGAADALRAAYGGVMTERAMLHGFFQPDALRSSLSALSQASLFFRTQSGEVCGMVGRGWYARYRSGNVRKMAEALAGKKQADFAEADRALLRYADSVYEKVLPIILNSELTRGENEGLYSACVFGILYVRGTAWLGRILAALGKENLARSSLLPYTMQVSRKDSLCHLLSVCVPAPEDGVSTLNRIVEEYKIPEKRLFELAMYNPAWVELIGEYLRVPGFVSAVYYFIAHMNENFDEARKAVIARFTPLTAEELNAGAFDIVWFRSAWEQVGEKNFDQLYGAAKYITDGVRHTRARKYADAALGRLTVEETENQIREKRNKDLLMAYPLIPLAGEEDALRRFLFIQQFIKESKQFGAQRSVSEKKAGEMALKNLAANSGDRDVTRLTLRMEGRLMENSLPLFENQQAEDVAVRLEIDPDGGVAVVCEKDGKRLKSVPARLKKNEAVLRLTEAKKELTEQYRRTRAFLEDAMTEEIFLTGAELTSLRKNPIARALVDGLIFKSGERFGLPCEEGLTDDQGNILPWADCAAVQVAHPFHLYRAKVWHAWQGLLFAQKIRQPFKQVFRELYVKTNDELGRTDSLRYAGYQIQPKKAAAALKTRRWVADTEAGLQKVFYQENIVAVLYAQADWFTPADIEAPAIEGVGFLDRLTGKPLKIDDLPDVLFSEIMRDVDLAVSVAYVGGVDPEASHSTVEMRRALLEFTLPLFGIANVRIEKNHAIIQGKRANYTVHLGSGVIHQQGGAMLQIVAVHSQHRGKLFLPFLDSDPQTAEILTKVLFLAEDDRIQDPNILSQIR